MLQPIGPGIWHTEHHFKVVGVPVSSRMTVVQLGDGSLWLHSPVPLGEALRAELAALGPVACIVAPNRTHHLFAKKALAAYPQARLYGPPSLRSKRPDLAAMIDLAPAPPPEWAADIDQVFIEGIPIADETAWFHKRSGTLVMTDLCQWWRGDLPWRALFYARLCGVRDRLAVPRTVRLVVRDRTATRRSVERILQWPIERVVVAHNAVIDRDAMPDVRHALGYFLR